MKKHLFACLLFALFLLPCTGAFAQYIVTTIAGIGPNGTIVSPDNYNGDSILATHAGLSYMGNAIVDTEGNIYVADDMSRRVRKIDPNGIITTVAGGGSVSYYSGAPATAVSIEPIECIAFDHKWNMYLCFSNSIKKMTPAGIISDFAGSSSWAYIGDGGPATAAGLHEPIGIAFDDTGCMYFSDLRHNVVRRIDTFGIITTVAGTGYTVSAGYGDFSGDGGPATAAHLSFPGALAIDTTGDLYISDEFNYRVRKLDMATGIIHTVVGSGPVYPTACTFSGEGGPATSATVDAIGLAFDSTGTLFISSVFTDRVCKIDAAGNIHTVAGTGVEGFSGDGGDAMAAQFANLDWATFDNCGNLLVTDDMNNRIRKITFNPPVFTPTITVTASPSTATAGTIVTLNATVSGVGPGYTISWLKNGILFGTTTGTGTITYTKTAGTDSIVATVADRSYKQCYINKVSTTVPVLDPTVAVSDAVRAGIRIYPNPTNDMLYIETPGGYRDCEIVNSVGRSMGIYPLTGGQATAIDTRQLPPGIYLLTMTGADGHLLHIRFTRE